MKKINKIIDFLLKYGLIFISIIVLIIGVLSVFITAYFNATFYHPEEKTYFKYTIGIIELLISAFAIFLITLFSQKVFKKIPSIFILLPIMFIAFLVFIIWINAMKLNPETDQKMIHDMAIALLEGNLSNFTVTARILIHIPFSIWTNTICFYYIQNIRTKLFIH